jgi:ABC-type Fe3+ transport system permease subunit
MHLYLDLGPFGIPIDAVEIAAAALWSLALYLGFSPIADWLIEQLVQWLNYAERSLYTSMEEFERTRPAREAQNSFSAALLSIFPFLIIGSLCHYLLEQQLDRSWSMSVGILAVISCGIYDLGRRQGRSDEDS